ncbi:CoA transferase [Breoghania sp. L-A4]|uniref:CaiB/BaiF CoA transferase family protein n=1 Tax=Breoghania sp. L-A4 TaxID=2304600 RepID=UPI000E36024E|nr:CoA transferase [Breoghania sp. L-A4]AXS40585.1 CoA transferase [Breoghania sp. L-A4]
MQPLDGIRVLDFTTLLPGPLATLMLAEAGAHVTKIEKPGGEDMRHYPPFVGGVSAPFALLNRGKTSVEIDLKAADAIETLRPMIEQADILVEQFRPGVMARLGLGYEALKAINPRLIYCSISGYGQTGPRAGEAGHDLNYVGNTGLLALSHGDTDAPTVPPALVADIGGGSFPALANILLALIARQRTGEGCCLDIAMADAAFTFAVFAQAELAATGKVPVSGQGLLTGGSPRYRLYPAADGRLIAVASLEQKFWITLCDVLDIPQELRDDRIDPQATARAIAGAIREKTSEEWRPLLAKADCCATVVLGLEEAMQDPHFRARGLFDHIIEPGGLPAAAVPIAPGFRKTTA